MAEIPTTPHEPRNTVSNHLSLADLEARWRALPEPPRDSGILFLIVCRRSDGSRLTPRRLRLTPEEGVPGDRWSFRLPRDPGSQLAVMRRDVAALIANGQPLTVFGDNLFVDFDISNANLPVGTRLRVGEAILEVTPHLHNGCVKFKARFGKDALNFVNAKPTRDQNLRGIYWKVIEAGEAGIGSTIQVLARG